MGNITSSDKLLKKLGVIDGDMIAISELEKWIPLWWEPASSRKTRKLNCCTAHGEKIYENCLCGCNQKVY